MGLREDIIEMKKEVEKVQNETFALQILSDYKRQNKRLFIVWLVTFIAFTGLLVYTIYLLNDIGTIEETTTQEVTDIDTINGSVVNKGDINGENKTKNNH